MCCSHDFNMIEEMGSVCWCLDLYFAVTLSVCIHTLLTHFFSSVKFSLTDNLNN